VHAVDADGLPDVRQQFFEAMFGREGKALEHVAQVGVGIVAVEPGALDQAHHDRSPPTGAGGAGEQPVRPAERDRADAVLHPVVVDREASVAEV
jgi:hypothetical protein